ncbi:MAG: tetratricopeptide repeat protein [bacterium]
MLGGKFSLSILISCLLFLNYPVAVSQSKRVFVYTSLARAKERFATYKEMFQKGEYPQAEKALKDCLRQVRITYIKRLLWEVVFYKGVAVNPAKALFILWKLLYLYPEDEIVLTLGQETKNKLEILLGSPENPSILDIPTYATLKNIKINKETYAKLKEALLVQIEKALSESESKLHELINTNNPLHWSIVIEKHAYILQQLRSACGGLLVCLGDLYLQQNDLARARSAYKTCLELYPDSESAILAGFKLQEIERMKPNEKGAE